MVRRSSPVLPMCSVDFPLSGNDAIGPPPAVDIPTFIVHSLGSSRSTSSPSSRQVPAEPRAEGAPHDQLFVLRRQPRQFLREHRHALPPRDRHARDVGPPEHALGPEGVVKLPNVSVDVAVRIRLGGVARRACGLQRHVGELRRRDECGQVRPGGVGSPEVIDDQLKPRMAFCDFMGPTTCRKLAPRSATGSPARSAAGHSQSMVPSVSHVC